MGSFPLVHYILSTYAVPYLCIGVITAIVIDVTIHYAKSSERLTFLEIWGAIVFWPLVLYAFLKGFFNQD